MQAKVYYFVFCVLSLINISLLAQEKIMLGHDRGDTLVSAEGWPAFRDTESIMRFTYFKAPDSETGNYRDSIKLMCRRFAHYQSRGDAAYDFGCEIQYSTIELSQKYYLYNAIFMIDRLESSLPDGTPITPELDKDEKAKHVAHGHLIKDANYEKMCSHLGKGFVMSEMGKLIDHSRHFTETKLALFQGVRGDAAKPETLRACFKSNFVDDPEALKHYLQKEKPHIFRPNLELKVNDVIPATQDRVVIIIDEKEYDIRFQRKYKLTHIEPANEELKTPAWVILEPVLPEGFVFRD
jgi:hypothetical protein